MTARLRAAIVLLAATPAFAHRLDEYLEGTLISVQSNRLDAQMVLTPGVAVFPLLIAYIDTDANGIISNDEQRKYADRVLHDLSLSIDGHRLTPRLAAITFPSIADMQEGLGEIHLDFTAELPPGGRNRKIILENHHLAGIAAYQVNSLVSQDPRIRIETQNRNYTQSHYELEYVDANAQATAPLAWLSPLALLLFVRITFLKRRASNTAIAAI